ncbi:hypothetical protein D3C79_153880 [compost metagenome]
MKINVFANSYWWLLGISAVCSLSFSACKKEKLDVITDNRPVTENRPNSNSRIINLFDYNQLIANGDSLTNFVVLHPLNPGNHKYPGTSYFPTDGRLGKIWPIPQDLFNQNEEAELSFAARYYAGFGLDHDLKVNVNNSYDTPKDYFLLPTTFMNGQPEVVSIARVATSPSKPDHFKIRIVNLAGAIKNPASGLTGPQENLVGEISLAYADGTLVSPKTNAISVARKVSDYVELPYGTYQFKVLLQDGRPLPALGSERHEYGLIDLSTSTIPENHARSTNLVYAPIQDFKPGGVYTIVVAPQKFSYISNEIDETVNVYQNSFQIITDIAAPVNQSYLRIQGVNAYKDQSIGFKIEGKTLVSGLDFGEVSGYGVFTQKRYTIEAVDNSGNVIASLNSELRSNQNYTIWIYPDQNGKAQLLLIANDLSGTLPLPAEDDGTYSRLAFKFFFFNRFLNLSIGNPYITFTLPNGQAIGNHSNVNLQPGIPSTNMPYTNMNTMMEPYQIMAYRSKPDVVPGVWAEDINVLKSTDFIADKSLYTKIKRALPAHEPGIYTVALIGKSGAGASANEKARMIIIKHNK